MQAERGPRFAGYPTPAAVRNHITPIPKQRWSQLTSGQRRAVRPPATQYVNAISASNSHTRRERRT
jgi:hypothetical protein